MGKLVDGIELWIMSGKFMGSDNPSAELSLSFGQLVSAPFVAFVLGAMLIYLTDLPVYLGFDDWAVSLIWGSILAVATFGLVILLTRLPFSKSLREICKQLVPIFEGLSLWKILAISLAAGVGEELLFRGFFQQWLAGYMRIEVAILLAALVFGYLHFASVSYFALTFVLGALFGITYAKTHSLLLVISWHAVYDMLIIWVFSRKPKLLLLE